MGEWKPIAEIPQDLHNSLWGGLDDGVLEVCFWENDDEAGLHLMLLPEQIKEIADYGVSDELIDWMREKGLFTLEWTVTLNDKISNYESFKITDEIVSQFYAA